MVVAAREEGQVVERHLLACDTGAEWNTRYAD